MPRFFILISLGFFITITLSACFNETTEPQKKVERPVEYDQFGNEAVYTADGERELIDDDCD